MDAPGKLKETLKKDIDSSFNKLIEECSIREMDRTIKKAKTHLNEELNHDITDRIKNGLKKGFDLIDLLKRSKKASSKKIGIAALEYLLDPWDIIPDFISDDGFLDDIYVINRAITWITEEESNFKTEPEIELSTQKKTYSDWLIIKVGGAAGPHLAKRAKELDILNSYQRRALFDIGRKHLYGYELSRKQHSFFETLIENSIAAGILEYECPDAPCKYCDALNSIFGKNTF